MSTTINLSHTTHTNIHPHLTNSLSHELDKALDRILYHENKTEDNEQLRRAEARVERIVRYLQKQAYLTGAASRRSAWSENLVLVIYRATGTEECARYVGRVFVDDVYSDKEMYQTPSGYSAWYMPADRHARRGKYPLLSEAIDGGLYHYGCKCWHVSYFEGSTPTDYQGERIPSFVNYEVSVPERTENQGSPITEQTKNQNIPTWGQAEPQANPTPDVDSREHRMQNYARLVEAATLQRETEMGTIVNLREWFDSSLRYMRERYSNVSGSMGKKPGTGTIIVQLSANGISGYAEFRDGVDGTRIDGDGNIFVDPQVLRGAFGRVIDPPITHTPVADSIRFGLSVGAARGVGRVVNWLDHIANNAGQSSKFAGRPFSGTRNPAADFKNGKLLRDHFERHGQPHFSHANEQAYLRAARNFLEKRPTSTTQSFVSREGTYFRYDARTNEFAIMNRHGGISTYFKPDTGLAYWLEQVAKYAPR